MSNAVDYYDVQGMIRDEIGHARAEWRNAINAASEYLRAELDELSRELRALIAAVAEAQA